MESTIKPRTILRIGKQSLAFSLMAADGKQLFEPYVVKSGMSMAANLREAFRDSAILTEPNTRAAVLIDTQTLMVPLEEFQDADIATLYAHSFPERRLEAVLHYVMPDLNCVAVFGINKDVRTVITDHYDNVRFIPLMTPVWQHLHQRSYSGMQKKLYCYYHDNSLDIFCYAKNRFRFTNSYRISGVNDCTYFMLYVWQQVAMDQKKDELYLVGNFPEPDTLKSNLKRFVQNVFVVNPVAEFNRAQVTQIPNITYDMINYVLTCRETD